jgi:tetratricopeptide (TPR) repeat protein
MQNAALSDQEREAVASAMRYGLELHKRGALDQAGALYAGVLKLAPRHVEALHYLGVIKNQQGHVEEALDLMATALELNAGWAQMHTNYAFMLNGAGRHDEALEATARALAIEPVNRDAEFHRGNALMGLDRASEALDAFERAVALRPGDVDPVVNRGNALVKLKRFEEAVVAFKRAIELAPGHAGILNNYGQALGAVGRHDEAMMFFDRALAIDPTYVSAVINRAKTLVDLDRPDEALAAVAPVLADDARHTAALDVRGLALVGLGRCEEAIATFEDIMAVDPDMATAYNHRGMAQTRLNRFDQARSSFEIALEILPNFKVARTNEAITYMVAGDYAVGLPKFEARWEKERVFDAPLWLGEEALAGKTLLIHAEQGLGDTLQFVRYAPLAAARGARVVVEAPPALKPVLAGAPGIADVVAPGEALPPFDLHCPMMSLPLAFHTTLATIPAQVPYLAAPLERVAQWKSRLRGDGQRRIGLVWSGNRKHKDDRNRSMAPQHLAPLFAVPGTQWIALQPELTARDRSFLAAHPGIQAIGGELADFGDTAAVMAGLDLVVSVDTAAVHLAGALGRPVWVMLPFSPDWRWLMQRPDSPWYPTARLFRQPATGDWDAVVAQVTAALATFGS